MFLLLYNSVPDKITIFEGQKLNGFWGISANAKSGEVGDYECSAMLFDIFPIKTVSVSVEPKRYVIPSGEAIGVRLYTEGVLVIGSGSVIDNEGNEKEPAKRAGISAGDRIIAVDGVRLSDTDSLKRLINREKGHVILSVIRDNTELKIPIDAVYSQETNSYLIGLWVRDSAAGIGTLTFYNPQNSTFAALGHGICDYDTGTLLYARSGSIGSCRIKSVNKSEDGNPGELLGEFSVQKTGDILMNTEVGIYGNAEYMPDTPLVPVASRFETQTGNAQILCDIDGNGPRAYDIEITRISYAAKLSGKNFVFKIRDSELLEKAGGIVQGMSGSPVLQNGKLVGAVTHVFVNDSSRGYGIFAESMLDMANMIK